MSVAGLIQRLEQVVAVRIPGKVAMSPAREPRFTCLRRRVCHSFLDLDNLEV
jgi:hypothetical protein